VSDISQLGLVRTNYCTGCKARQDTIEAQAAEIKRLIPMVKDALEKGRHRLLKEGFSPQDPTVRAMNEAIRALAQQEPTP
jgi:hypothetical protein